MAKTITTNTYLDEITGLLAGDAMTINGGILTIRTDTRVHAKAPANMTGTLGSCTISSTLGGGVFIDGTKVRLLPFNSGSGNVPDIGVNITQGGVASSYLLGVYPDLVSAPISAGASMPTSGFIKFREVDGIFTSGTLTGISATATGADVTGLIEVVERQSAANTVPRLGSFIVRGDWFYLDPTNGSAGQILQVPTNGGGSGTHVPAVWIETGVGTDEYEIYPTLRDTMFSDSNLSTDERCKFVNTIGNGQLRIGQDGSANLVGFVPPSGCKVRVPNIFGRQAAAVTLDSVNLEPHATGSTRPDFSTTASGYVDFENFMNDLYHSMTSPFYIRMVNTAIFEGIVMSNVAAPCDIDNLCISPYLGTSLGATLTSNFLGGIIKNSKIMVGSGSNRHAISMATSVDYNFENCHLGVVVYARSTGKSINTSQCDRITMKDIYQYNCYMSHATSSNVNVKNLDHTDRFVGETNSTTALYLAYFNTTCMNCEVDGMSLGLKGLIPNVNPYTSIAYVANSTNIVFKNAGSQDNPLVCNPAAAPAYVAYDYGVNNNVKFQRMYVTYSRTSPIATKNTSKNVLFEHIHGTIGAIATATLNATVRGIRGSSASTTGQAAVYGTHLFDMFISDNSGYLLLAMNEETAFTSQYITKSLGAGAGFTSAGQISMPNIDDQVIVEMPYFVLGHTGFADNLILTGTNVTTNFLYELDIDTGSGFSGSLNVMYGGTIGPIALSDLVIDPSIGFRFKFRITTKNASATNALTYVKLTTSSTLSAQMNNLYPLVTVDVKISDYKVGSRIQLYDLDNSIELYNGVPTGDTLTYSAVYSEDFNIRVRTMYADSTSALMFDEFTDIVTSNGLSRKVNKVDDKIYALNGVDGFSITTITIDDTSLLVNIDTGQLSLADIYAYETYLLQTEEGIRDESRFIEAKDAANYLFEDFRIKNTSSPSTPLVITGGLGRDSVTEKTVDIIDPSGGTIFSSPDLVIAYATTGGTTSGGATASEILNYGTRKLTSVGSDEIATKVLDVDPTTVNATGMGATVKKILAICKNIFSVSA